MNAIRHRNGQNHNWYVNRPRRQEKAHPSSQPHGGHNGQYQDNDSGEHRQHAAQQNRQKDDDQQQHRWNQSRHVFLAFRREAVIHRNNSGVIESNIRVALGELRTQITHKIHHTGDVRGVVRYVRQLQRNIDQADVSIR